MMPKMFKRSAAIAAFSLVCLVLAGITVTAATNGTGFQYQYNAGNQQVTLTTPKLDIRVTTGGNVPHFMFWDPNITQANLRIIYHVQFVQVIEFIDTDDDGVYSPGSDMVVAPILALGSVDWTFSGFITEEDNGEVTAIHFNFTLNEVDGSRYDSLYMELRCHVNASNANELKFDIVMMGWPWTNNESLLALRWDLMIQSPGLHTYQHAYQFHHENQTFQFDGAFFSYKHSANAGNDTVPVDHSFEDKPDKTTVYLVYPNFGDTLLEHDPSVGIGSSFLPPDGGLPLLLVVAAGALATVVIAVAIWTRRRN